jgi:hypothetical protein
MTRLPFSSFAGIDGAQGYVVVVHRSMVNPITPQVSNPYDYVNHVFKIP